jgi:anti-anti-sigma regulatory factor
MKDHDAAFSPPSVEASKDPDDTLVLKIKGRLDAYSTGKIWKDSSYELEKSNPRKLTIDGEGIEYCDASGIALLIELRLIQ